MALTWILSEIRTEFRALTGRSSTGEISDAAVNNQINDYYQHFFPEEVGVSNFRTDFTQELLPTDDGEYTLAQTVIAVEEPVTINGVRISLFTDKTTFFDLWPEDEHTITAPTLVVGTTNAAHVKYSAFAYTISGKSYSETTGEVALSGDAVPQNKYGAWLLSIDTDGDITITPAGSNSDGYTTAAQAIDDLAISEECAVMGFVTAICSSGTFTPGTTELNTGADVTATFTDGRPGLRGTPTAALVFGNKLFVRARPDDIYQFEAQMTLQRPAALSGDSDAPPDVKWGQAIATGAAIKWLATKEGELERLTELNALHMTNIRSIKRKRLLQWINADRTAGS